MAKKIKVLTFGWEFPPHISGGLGTACYGLTKSLMKEGTDVLFVVPRTHGDEEIGLIDASEVYVSHSPAEASNTPLETRSLKGEMQILPVASGIRPYSPPGDEPLQYLERWNYEIKAAPAGKKILQATTERKYRFSGSYGPSLLQEVLRYADVGAVVARDYKFDFIHAHDWLTFPAGIAAKRASGKPLVIHVHATEYDRAGAQHVDVRVLAIEKEGMERADRIVAVSEWTKQIIVSKYGIKAEKVTVVHNGAIQGKYLPPLKPARMGENVVTFLGRVTYQKGPQYFVEAARKVLEKFPDTHFVVAGSGDMLPSMIERVASLRLSSRFHFTGFLRPAQVEQVWSVTDVYVMPSVSEPFGIAPLEAIRAGVPVIISNQSGVSEVMPHAIKADFWDTQALANAICSILRNKVLARTLKKNGKRILKDITWKKAARKLNQLYHEIGS